MFMSVIGCIVLGLIAGYIANRLANKRGEGPGKDIGIGIVGAVTGGLLFNDFGATGATGFNVWSLAAPLVGAVVLLVVWYVIRRSPAHA